MGYLEFRMKRRDVNYATAETGAQMQHIKVGTLLAPSAEGCRQVNVTHLLN